MLLRPMVAAVVVMFALAPVHAQQNGASQGKAQQQGASQAKATQNAKSAPKGKRVVQGPKQRHQCKVGPYEKQTRLVMETVKNKPVYIAYWSSNGPFHCSFETWPGDGRAQWVDSQAGTVINLIKGTMRIERNGDKYYLHADEVDRMPYCGTFGHITGVLTIPTKKGQCDWKEMSAEDGNVLKQKEAPPEAEPAQAPQDAAPAPEGGTSTGVESSGRVGLADPS